MNENIFRINMFQRLISRQTFSEFLFPLRAGWPLPSQHICVAYVIDEKVLPSVVLVCGVCGCGGGCVGGGEDHREHHAHIHIVQDEELDITGYDSDGGANAAAAVSFAAIPLHSTKCDGDDEFSRYHDHVQLQHHRLNHASSNVHLLMAGDHLPICTKQPLHMRQNSQFSPSTSSSSSSSSAAAAAAAAATLLSCPTQSSSFTSTPHRACCCLLPLMQSGQCL